MKVSRLEAHDRLLHLQKDQADVIAQGASDCLLVNPLSLALQDESPYVYLFAHPRTLGLDEKISLFNTGRYESFERIPEKVLMWQPRLSRPMAQTNSYLFRAESKTDLLEICWLLPPEEMWAQYQKGKVTENESVIWSIDQFLSNKGKLEASRSDDLSDEKIKAIYIKVARSMEKPKFEVL